MTDNKTTDTTNEAKEFEYMFKMNVLDIVVQYADRHNPLIAKYKPTLLNIFKWNDNEEKFVTGINEVTDMTYQRIRNVFHQAQNEKREHNFKMSEEFETLNNEMQMTENSYEGVHKLVLSLNKYSASITKRQFNY